MSEDRGERNERAFPSAAIDDRFGGMTLRDWFAGRAFSAAWDACDKGYFEGAGPEIAECAYQMADAMMAERAKRPAP